MITASAPSWIAPSSEFAADRVIRHLGPLLALRPRKRFRKNTVLIVDGTLVPTRDHTVAEQSKNYRYSTNHQVVVDADSCLVVVVGQPLPGNHNDCKAEELSGAKASVGSTTVVADGGYRGTGPVIPHRRERGQSEAQLKGACQGMSLAGTLRSPSRGGRPRSNRRRRHEYGCSCASCKRHLSSRDAHESNTAVIRF
nr:transposase [Streptomyces anulatus]